MFSLSTIFQKTINSTSLAIGIHVLISCGNIPTDNYSDDYLLYFLVNPMQILFCNTESYNS